jgi:hypothetical protein
MLRTVAGTKALKKIYLQDAENILGSLSSSYLGPRSGESVLFDGYPGGLNGKNTALIYSDYYFTDALLRLQSVLPRQPGRLLSSLTIPEPSTWGDDAPRIRWPTTFQAAPTRRISPRRNGSISSRANSIWVGTNCASRSLPIRSGSA